MAKVAKGMIDPDDAVMLLIDHQSGLFQLVKDIDMLTLRQNVVALAKAAHLTKTPTFTTASVPDGPNGPLIPEIHEANPEAVYIPRTGQINAWDNPKWVEAIEETGRKSLIIAGTLTSVCMAFPTLSAIAAGYKVFNVVDASGNYSSMATDITLARVVQAGAVPTDTFATLPDIVRNQVPMFIGHTIYLIRKLAKWPGAPVHSFSKSRASSSTILAYVIDCPV